MRSYLLLLLAGFGLLLATSVPAAIPAYAGSPPAVYLPATPGYYPVPTATLAESPRDVDAEAATAQVTAARYYSAGGAVAESGLFSGMAQLLTSPQARPRPGPERRQSAAWEHPTIKFQPPPGNLSGVTAWCWAE